jgi:PhzF family phenazine biosynthesis protein
MTLYRHVDVFAETPLTGNGVVVFLDCEDLNDDLMLRITREMRQFESIFISANDGPSAYHARIFSAAGELEFAGHPVLGAAAALHDMTGEERSKTWHLRIAERMLEVNTERRQGGGFLATMDQGMPSFGPTLDAKARNEILTALGLEPADLMPGLPCQVVSTGLRYLIVPLSEGLARTAIHVADFESRLKRVGAQFVYVLDVGQGEGRHWENDGSVEDVATGSAAGPAASYMFRYGVVDAAKEIVLHQGSFVGRPSVMRVRIEVVNETIQKVLVGGPVSMVASGSLDPGGTALE